jgi:molybdenum cofactor biosynthesis enzyme
MGMIRENLDSENMNSKFLCTLTVTCYWCVYEDVDISIETVVATTLQGTGIEIETVVATTLQGTGIEIETVVATTLQG